MKILAAIDGSEASLHAAAMASTLAQNAKGTVTLIHVTAPFVPLNDLGVMLPDPTAQLRSAGQKMLEEVRVKLGLPVTTELLERVGAPAEVVADAAHALEFDMVVIGTKGRGAVSRMLLGSTADRLVHICTKPVLVVR